MFVMKFSTRRNKEIKNNYFHLNNDKYTEKNVLMFRLVISTFPISAI